MTTARPEPFSHRTHTTTTRELPGGGRASVPERTSEVQRRIDEWAANNPEVITPFGRENLAPAHAFASVAMINDSESFEQMWVDRFTQDEDLMWLIVGDIVRYVSADEIPRGTRVSSRRQVQDKDRNLTAVWRVLHGHYSNDPFPISVKELIGKRSLRDFAARSGFGSVQTLIRYQRGERPLTMMCMEGMAKAGRVEPHYFVEYRALWLGRELQRAMLARPNESLKAIKMIRDAVT